MPADTVFVLRRLNWMRNGEHSWLRLPGETRVNSFDRFADAEAERQRLEADERIRDRINPFRCGPTLYHQTHFDADRLHDWVMDAGLQPPTPGEDGQRDWAGWWEEESFACTPDQESRVWEACDRVRFYDVIESPRRPVLYVVVRTGWMYNDNWWDASSESVRAYRERERADAVCAEANANEVRDPGSPYYQTFQVVEIEWEV